MPLHFYHSMMAPANRNANVGQLDEESPQAEQPPNARLVLRPHQLALLHRCRLLETGARVPLLGATEGTHTCVSTAMGLLGDAVGSGKSYVLLALVLGGAPGCATQNGVREPTVRNYAGARGFATYVVEPQQQVVPTNVLVVPHSLRAQWSGYVAEFCVPGAVRSMVVSSPKTLAALRLAVLGDLELLIVTQTYYSSVSALLAARRVRVARAMYDEADGLSLPASAPLLDAAFSWYVTASYVNLLLPRGTMQYDAQAVGWSVATEGLRRSGFMRTLFCELGAQGAPVGALVVRCSDHYMRSSVELPEPVVTRVACRTPATIRVLQGVVGADVIESLNAGDMASALQLVWGGASHRASEDNIIAVLVDRLARLVKNLDSRLECAATLLEFDNDAARDAEVGRLQRKRDEAQRKVDCIRERVRGSETCCICFEGFEEATTDGGRCKTLSACCSNAFCIKCIGTWLSRGARMCPLCKASLEPSDMLVVVPPPPQLQEPQAEPQDGGGASTSASSAATSRDKLESLADIVAERRRQEGRTKLLILSSYDNTFVQVAGVLDSMGVRHAGLKGNGNVVRNIVENYKSGDIDALLVNTHHYGSGLNLENTTDIVLFHNFDGELEKQVIGRAQRFGRTEPLRIWYLLYENEVMVPG